MKTFGLYLLEKRYHAVWVVLLCAFLPFLGIPAFPIAAIILGLVTLHKGTKEGFFLLCWALLPEIVASFYGGFGNFSIVSDDDLSGFIVLLAVGFSKPIATWLMASFLGRTSSWAVTLQLTTLGAVIIIIAFHLFMSDVSAWWLQQLIPHSKQIGEYVQTSFRSNVSVEQIKQVLEVFSYFATGVLVLSVLSVSVTFLIAARWWQALLFNPGGLILEWRQLCISRFYSGVLLVVLVFIWLDVAWSFDVLPVLLMPFVFAGLSLLHTRISDRKNIRLPLLILLYMGLLLFFPYMSMFLILLAFLDSWLDFRSLRRGKA